MKRVCFLSMDDMTGYVADDDLAIEPLATRGISVETLSWRQTALDWSEFDLVVIRTTWDYQRQPSAFLSKMDEIASKTRLANPPEVCRWNFDKRYLAELEQKGVSIVPTLWGERYDARSFDRWLEQFKTDELIIKPTVSATAEHTYRLASYREDLTGIFAERPFMVQPFLHEVVDDGEYSLFYFNGRWSHAIVKRPKPDDFRVQEEHGGIITEIEPESAMLAAADALLSHLPERLLYARIDLVRHRSGFALMELELIEPALYLRMSEGAADRFAEAIAEII